MPFPSPKNLKKAVKRPIVDRAERERSLSLEKTYELTS
jgi:hypothetical protein